jgi:adenylylsulfate kinase-like enzyme
VTFATRAPLRPTPDLATCRARDVKGLYARQARGELRGLTGVDFSRPEVARLLADGYRAQRG